MDAGRWSPMQPLHPSVIKSNEGHMNRTTHHPMPARRGASILFYGSRVSNVDGHGDGAFSSFPPWHRINQPRRNHRPSPPRTRDPISPSRPFTSSATPIWTPNGAGSIPQVISEYLSKTMHANFDLFEKYPHYIFNFSGANRYRMMKEYFPADYEKLRHYVKAGRWFPAGSSMEENDVNSPSPESIIRQVLYGNEYFRHDFGVASAEFMLPDCFGFPASLPSILAAAGVKGFSTQKLSLGLIRAGGRTHSPEQTPKGIPFNVGIWDGPGGKSVMAAFNPAHL